MSDNSVKRGQPALVEGTSVGAIQGFAPDKTFTGKVKVKRGTIFMGFTDVGVVYNNTAKFTATFPAGMIVVVPEGVTEITFSTTVALAGYAEV